jgi:hypothetical protein
MQNIILKELRLVMNPEYNILLILIRYLLTPEKASCQESGRIFLDKNYDSNFLTSPRPLVLKARPTGTKFNQDYFFQATFAGLHNEKT